MEYKFHQCYSLVAIPMLDTSMVITMYGMFYQCYSIVCIPLLNTSKVETMTMMFYDCRSLASFPLLDTKNVKNASQMFENCFALTTITIDANIITTISFINCYRLVSIRLLNASKLDRIESAFNKCYSLVSISPIDVINVSYSQAYPYCYSLVEVYLKNLTNAITFKNSPLLSKSSVLYMIENEAATKAITITLHSYAYSRLAEDADIVNALTNHPNISLASA